MFNGKAKKDAINKLEGSVKNHESIRKQVQASAVDLFHQRQRAADEVIKSVEAYVNQLANTPKEFNQSVAKFRVNVNRFDRTVQQITVEAARVTKVGSASAGTGALAGVGVAAFGPTAAMAIATTFGTASTGTAIASLSGAAATKAALAWLGGGALAAGGGGMAAGNALLALAGPVGWAIGGTAIIGSGVYMNQKNAKLAETATKERIKVEAEVRSLKVSLQEVTKLKTLTQKHTRGCLDDLSNLRSTGPSNYAQFSTAQKERMAGLINNINALSELLNKEATI